ncbi:phage holin family protein [Solitalea koreensis]|uniref:Putative membrane protein n=1 Tax=Solitalea koreensis TaxID=543615 RepID=A0A521C411_9SPHI|nr:phage holin family protein [Solitalea koreensis]SMO54217.1 putative membrane protein [Solitalea koreensis]
MNFIIKIIITGLVAFGLTYILPGVHIKNIETALILALVLAILNMLLKPLLVLFTLPITILTLGLFLFVINALIIQFAAKLVTGFIVDGFWSALLFSLLLSVATSMLSGLTSKE